LTRIAGILIVWAGFTCNPTQQETRLLHSTKNVYFFYGRLCSVVSSVAEIEAAIEKLPVPPVDQLADWLEGFLQRRVSTPALENWFLDAKGEAVPDAQTQAIMNPDPWRRITLLDTNVLLDIATADPVWLEGADRAAPSSRRGK
jgi:hypothetical protein